jgi:hypothetical protein
MKKWEYLVIDSRQLPGGGTFKGKDREIVDIYLNKLGDAGWEIIELNFREVSKGYEFVGLARREKVE